VNKFRNVRKTCNTEMVDIKSGNVNKPEMKDRLSMFKLHVLRQLSLINPECRETFFLPFAPTLEHRYDFSVS
jgi:hypothetical protein